MERKITENSTENLEKMNNFQDSLVIWAFSVPEQKIYLYLTKF